MRIIGGRDAQLGEAPYQARIRYFRKMTFGSQKHDHQRNSFKVKKNPFFRDSAMKR